MRLPEIVKNSLTVCNSFSEMGTATPKKRPGSYKKKEAEESAAARALQELQHLLASASSWSFVEPSGQGKWDSQSR